MPPQFHRVMKDPAHEDPVPFDPVDQKVTGSPDTCSATALLKMPGEDTFSEFGPGCAADSVSCGGGIAERRDDKCLVAVLCLFAEFCAGTGEDLSDVDLCRL